MTTEQWFEKFDELQPGDTVCFEGVFTLTVTEIISDGGCVFTNPLMEDGEIVPVGSPLWNNATIEGRSVNFIEEEEAHDAADWWKK